MFNFIWKYLKNYKLKLFILSLLMISSLTITSVSPYISGKFVDTIIEHPIKNNIKIFVIIGLVLGILGIVISYISKLISTEFIYTLIFKLESDIISHLHKTPYELFIETFNAPQLINRIKTDSETIIKFCIDNIFNIISNVILLIVVLILIGFINKNILLVMLIFIPMYILTYLLLKKPIFTSNILVKEEATIYFKNMYEQLNQIKEIKMDSLYLNSLKKMGRSFENFKFILIKNIKLVQSFKSIDSVISLLFQISVIIIGGFQIIDGTLSIGEYTILNTYFGILLNTIKYFFGLGEEYQSIKASYFRIKELLDLKTEKFGTLNLNSIESISMNNIEFTYKKSNFLFNQRNNTYIFKKGFIYCLQGKNGTGKSTFIDILTGIIQDISHGNIVYNDKNINELNIINLRKKNISVLLQHHIYADETVKNFFKTHIPITDKISINKDIINVFWDNENFFKEILNKKLQTLSLGELQKVYLIKTILKENDLLILDEPTSSLDSYSVEKLKDFLKTYKKNHIIIIINHDIRLNDLFDKIFILDN